MFFIPLRLYARMTELLPLGNSPLPNGWAVPAFCSEVIGDSENLPIVLNAVRDPDLNGPTGECDIQAVAVLVNIGGEREHVQLQKSTSASQDTICSHLLSWQIVFPHLGTLY